MADLILKVATKPKAATHWSVRAIVHLSFLQSHPTGRFRCVIAAPV